MEKLARPFAKIVGESSLVKAFAQAADIPWVPLSTEDADNYVADYVADADNVLIVFEGLRHALQSGDLQVWRNSLQHWEKNCFRPLWHGVRNGHLTQLTLGLDRDSSLVAHLYDERNPAVKAMLKMLIDTAKRNKVKVGICGQGPSDFPDFAQFLVDLGIDSISVTPDSLVKTVKAIYEVEKK